MQRNALFRAASVTLLSLCAHAAGAEGLSSASPRQLLASGAERVAEAARQTSTPVPLRPGIFVLPFATNQPGLGPAPDGAVKFQAINSSFAKDGDPGTLITGLEDCCASFAENGGAKLAGGRTQIALPLFTYDGAALEAAAFFIDASGSPVTDGGARLNRRREGNQSAPVVIPMKGGIAFALWADFFHESGESQSSVWGAPVSAEGQTSGPGMLMEFSNSGYQLPADGVQMPDGRLLIAWKTSGNSDITGRSLFYARFLRTNGQFSGPAFLVAANNDNIFGAQLRLAALPNGTFVAVWIDDRSGEPIPFYRIFSGTGEMLTWPQRVGAFRALGGRLDVAALADSRFVIVGSFTENTQSVLSAQLFSAVGDKVGAPLVLHALAHPNAAPEHHVANAGYLLGTPPATGGVLTATDARRVYVVWRVDRAGGRYDLYGRALQATP